jgi:hypothetical protein
MTNKLRTLGMMIVIAGFTMLPLLRPMTGMKTPR